MLPPSRRSPLREPTQGRRTTLAGTWDVEREPATLSASRDCSTLHFAKASRAVSPDPE
jgi:hypothetical protein